MNQTQTQIYNIALSGSPVNPGLPPALAALVAAQAAHETGNFTSSFFKKYNNAFGYSYAGSRYQSGAGSNADNGKPIGIYPSLEYSTYEMIDWLYRRLKEGRFLAFSQVTTPEMYAQALKSAGYYGDTVANYAAGLKRYWVAAGGGLVFVLLIAVFVVKFTTKR